nr:zinc finger protein 91 isoform X4 [Helicoverpa armigera]
METSVNNGMCRCCASEGAFKDVKSTYHWMGEEEIYSDMLRDCFDINLEVSEQGQDGGICEVCITQLRNAINFKKQVLHTEEQFKIHLQNKTMFRPNIVKVELQAGEDSDDLGSGDDAFSGPEFEVPIKMETEETKPKKRGAKASATTTRAKKAKADNGETSNKHEEEKLATPAKIKTEPETEDRRSNNESLIEISIDKAPQKRIKRLLYKHLNNLKIILECTNATMILGYGDKGFSCCYCDAAYAEPSQLKAHTLTFHANEEIFYGKLPTLGPSRFLVKLDITDLKCTLCDIDLETLENIFEHLKEKHEKTFHTDIKDQIFPFRFNTEQFTCCICPNNVVFDTFRPLHEHMHKHYRNFICEVCNAGFINHISLTRHAVIHTKGDFKCRYCSVVFDNVFKRRNHESRAHTHAGKTNICHFCNEGFKEYWLKELHLTKVHGVTPKIYNCSACEKTFSSPSLVKVHIRRFHMMEKNKKCPHCDRAFFRATDLKKHMLIHTGARDFKCEVCQKCFAKKSTLTQHMRIHNNDRRFKCEICDQAFVQKPSLTWHMRSKHPSD